MNEQSADPAVNHTIDNEPPHSMHETHLLQAVTHTPQPHNEQPLPTLTNTPAHAENAVNLPTKDHRPSNALAIVLQCITYILWFWTLGVLAAVLSAVLVYIFVKDTWQTTWVLYTAAALLVLLPLAVLSDKFYKRVESPTKHGFSAAIMVINAIVAAMCTVGAAIAIVFAVLDLALSTRSDATGNIIAFVSALVAAKLSALFFLRVIYIKKLTLVRRKFSFVVSAITVLTLLLVIVFPLSNEIKRKPDRIIEDNYSELSAGIESYSRINRRLPLSLSDAALDSDAKKVVDTGRVTYRVVSDTIPSPTTITPSTSSTSKPSTALSSRTAKYELCVDWNFERPIESNRYNYESASGYSSYYGHKAGKQCYTASVYISGTPFSLQ